MELTIPVDIELLETWLSDNRVGYYSMVDHRSLQPVFTRSPPIDNSWAMMLVWR